MTGYEGALILSGATVAGFPAPQNAPPELSTTSRHPSAPLRELPVVDLSCAPAPEDARRLDLRRVGAKAVLVGPAVPPALPFDVVESKLKVPQLLAGTVSRTALVNRLRAAGAFPLVLVVAPAGYGKTTLLSQWANRDARPFAWLSVDERDNDPVVLLKHIAAGIDRIEDRKSVV